MAIKDLVPKFGRSREESLPRRREADPFHDLQARMNMLFDDFFNSAGSGLAPRWGWGGHDLARLDFSPRVDVSETDKEVVITAELPGMDEKNLNVDIDDNALTITGEKREEKEDKGKHWHTRELSYGSFHRVVPLPAGVEADKAKARFKKGVLTVALPKSAEEQADRKKIQIESD